MFIFVKIYLFESGLNHFMPVDIIKSVKFPKGPMGQSGPRFFLHYLCTTMCLQSAGTDGTLTILLRG